MPVNGSLCFFRCTHSVSVLLAPLSRVTRVYLVLSRRAHNNKNVKIVCYIYRAYANGLHFSLPTIIRLNYRIRHNTFSVTFSPFASLRLLSFFFFYFLFFILFHFISFRLESCSLSVDPLRPSRVLVLLPPPPPSTTTDSSVAVGGKRVQEKRKDTRIDETNERTNVRT